ncbi:hypothetical protein D9758_010181 [Tetrapyrgos nigripes]|uniref:Aminotransferase class I/classII domain-containing protein n=1 Tax=Tetrapyrgos nigripes TaxID=182062 RepID=A0A8H5FUN8_9AGAR|nr:hypothetical protein D9758_010181 [Tetrapyrgos nigripes]
MFSTATSNLQVSSLTQVITHALLSKWGYDAFYSHTKSVSEFYGQKRDIFEAAMKRHLEGLAEWQRPEAGMFFWFKLLVPDSKASANTDAAGASEPDSKALIEGAAYANGVLALPGTVFLPNGGKSGYVRASFSLLTEEQVEEALKRLGRTIREQQGDTQA